MTSRALIIGFLLCTGLLNYNLCKAQVFVDIEANGSNDGTSWGNAFIDLQQALDETKEGEQIWIASGIYFPGKTGDPKTTTFHLNKDIELYGGFTGTETSFSERNPSENITTLSGDLNKDDIIDDFVSNRSDNVWTIMKVEVSTSIPIIDGISFKNGHADGKKGLNEASSGGGLFLYGPALVRNCTFSQNHSKEGGGALFFVDSLGIEKASLRIDSCQFNNNQSTSGGAVNVTLQTGKIPSIIIQHSNFSGNKSEEEGGGLHVFTTAKGAKILVDSCHFSNNFSTYTGGAISFQFYGNGNLITTQNTTFSNNQTKTSAGAVLMYSNRSSTNNIYDLKNCTFKNNSTTEYGSGQAEGGGAVYVATAGKNNFVYIQNTDFSKNSSKGFGGALGIRNKKPGNNLRAEISNCQFEENISDNGGGLFYESESIKDYLFVRQCQFTKNSTSELNPTKATRGGAMHIAYDFDSKEGKVLVEGCVFEYNQSNNGDGGALAISPFGQNCFSRILNSSFIGNKTTGKGGALFYMGADAAYELKACTFDNNEAHGGGALLYESQAFDKSQFYIFFHAVLWFQILYSLFFFIIVRERTSLYYALMLFGISLFFVVVFDSMHFPILNEISGSVRNMIYQTGVFFSIFGLVKFAQQYLNVNQLLPRFKKIIFYFLATFLFFELIYFARQFDLLGQFGVAAGILTFFGVMICFFLGALIPTIWAIITLRKGFKAAKYFLIAMLFSGLALSWLVLSFFQTGSISGIPIIYIECLLLLSIITLALADGYRINLLKKEKERAERLSELDTAKTRLYTNITHEFRTPLTVIMGASDQVKGNELEKKLIKRNSQQLLQLINQMLDLSKLEDGALQLELQQGNVIPFVQYLVESFQSMAESKHIRLTFYEEKENIQMDYDAVKMQQIISNLISNAIKFTDESGKIVVHAKEEFIKGKPHFILIVRDNGTGIQAEDLPHVFDRFFQVDTSDIRHSEGSGIGLALVKELVELMKGQIEITSEVNKGTVFTIQIPITKKAVLQTKILKENEFLLAIDLENEQESVPSFQPVIDERPLALIIEDNKDIVSFLRSCLQRKYKIEVAYNGKQGIDKAFDIVPDVIISDVMMPEADGFTVCKTLKEDERTSHVPIILLTAKTTQDDKIQGLEVGADAYLSKPFDQKELEVRLQKLIELRQQLQSRYQGNFITNNSPKNKEDAFIQKLQAIVQEKMEDENFSINDLCHAIGLSRMQIHRKLKALTGMPTTAFINSTRLQKAYELLSDTELNVSEVAYQVGFSNHSYFSKLFFNKFGKTPSEISNNN